MISYRYTHYRILCSEAGDCRDPYVLGGTFDRLVAAEAVVLKLPDFFAFLVYDSEAGVWVEDHDLWHDNHDWQEEAR